MFTNSNVEISFDSVNDLNRTDDDFSSINTSPLNILLNRFDNYPDDILKKNISIILHNIKNIEDVNLLLDLFILTFQKKNFRDEKGVMILNQLFIEIYKEYPKTVITFLNENSYYGYYKDFINILEMIELLYNDRESPPIRILEDGIINIVTVQLLSDKMKLDSYLAQKKFYGSVYDDKYPKLSLVSKFIPKEGIYFNKFAERMFGVSISSNELFLKIILALRAALEVPEVLAYAELLDNKNFANMPSLCVNHCNKSFLNEIILKKYSSKISFN